VVEEVLGKGGKGQGAEGICLLGLAPVCSGIVPHVVIDALRVGDARSCQWDEEPICVLSRVPKPLQGRSDVLMMQVFGMFRVWGLHLRAPPRCISPRLHALRSISWRFFRSPSRPCSAFCRAPSDLCCPSVPFSSLSSPTVSPSSRTLLSLPLLIPLDVALPSLFSSRSCLAFLFSLSPSLFKFFRS
jgi:hypothetical protein